MIKCAMGLNIHGERMKLMGRKNENDEHTSCNDEGSWEHVILREKNKSLREE